MKVHIKKGDNVVVLSGREGLRGATGKVKTVLPREGMVVVEGVNIVKKAVRPNPRNPQGGFIEQEAPLHASKVMPICPSCEKPTRIRKKLLDDGSKIRVCAKCGSSLETR
ncbi:50S ribosomal protein L24 [Meiothermus granaticius]|uniref:Large ribosomal subunit protein uL24 n=1 Tax=Meiothermus granaticius NBRC 107808 TaxID=1227551 RepID=A0A399F8D0_9DEIN|nr:50S ribosomal protein L24 [Meiothermus granaticius]MCL6527408.1 50S ribosomal protein L24 [Thermaceae bacterium]RIH92370.1 50S ribosomal protein L24 [Meiothermus granaticius NBRC 107808]GEM87406.1 50S ribosomal protein L24 [Meiothermus granaticius NBRC 107808]